VSPGSQDRPSEPAQEQSLNTPVHLPWKHRSFVVQGSPSSQLSAAQAGFEQSGSLTPMQTPL